MALYGLVGDYQRFGEIFCSHLQGIKMEIINIYRRENLESHIRMEI
jgi:hypothetical protein